MLFKPVLLVKIWNRAKRQTRRMVKSGDSLDRTLNFDGTFGPLTVRDSAGRIRWQVGRTYAAQPGRGKVQEGRIRILDIHNYEMVGEISEPDARDEGFEDARAFVTYFREINPRSKVTDLVWPLVFEPVEAGG